MRIEKASGLVHSLIISAVIGMIMVESWLFNIPDPTWAIISGVICTELEMDQARTLVLGRLLATLVGCALTLLVVVSLGTGYIAIICGVLIITLVCQYTVYLRNSWKVATAAGGIILVSNFHQNIAHAEILVYRRTVEVAMGSITAGVLSFILGRLWVAFKKKVDNK